MVIFPFLLYNILDTFYLYGIQDFSIYNVYNTSWMLFILGYD